MSVFVIAEAGVNHDGDVERARALIDVAVRAGADAVKFQTFKSEELVARDAAKAEYQKRATGAEEDQLAMLMRLELDRDAHHRLIAHCREQGIAFLSSPFDLASVAFLKDELGLDTLKIASGEITNAPLLLEAARGGTAIILSTGMSSQDEVEEALGVLAYGYLEPARRPGRDSFQQAFASLEGKAALADRVTLLHCTTEYPAPIEDANLRAIETLRQAFNLPVGLSDHTPGVLASVAAVALGATVIEKHITLDRNAPGPDHAASLDPLGFAELVESIRATEAALGDGVKEPRPSEMGNRAVARKALRARSAIVKGQSFTADNLAALRPGDGLSPMDWWERLGRPATRAYAPGEAIE